MENMQADPIQVVIAAFNSPERAGEVMSALKMGKRIGLVNILDAAVVVKDAEGRLKITDAKRRTRRGFITGGVVGGVIGLLTGPVGWAALGGGAIGTLVGRLQSAPLREEMKDIGSALTPNSSAIVAVIEHTWVSALEEALAEEGARVVREAIKADIAKQLSEGGNVLYTAASGLTGEAVARVAATEDEMRLTGVLLTDEGMFIGDAEFTSEEPEDEGPAGEEPTQT